ncbi:hypothetical protein [Priestia taiwanensis]|uniref:Uncharacterized protein n=1 Tax=Priestia taiwanensis TaxID=1347902 RepID=A0A917ERJ9_9BACI|nr:hypothetical protein [Priestia taiwanensis]MBM7364016.1 hypothetical protein [Priestia taiwanensis]GGE70996.1 hypothetical protein GCM10007140_21060 [Priestia taiwanensis]
MNKKMMFSLCFAGLLALPVNTAFSEDRSITVTKEEQTIRESIQIAGQDTSITITAEEQTTIENSSIKKGVFQQNNGTSFLFSK